LRIFDDNRNQTEFASNLSGDVRIIVDLLRESKRRRVPTKSGRQWTQEDLEAFGITIIPSDCFDETKQLLLKDWKLSDTAEGLISPCSTIDHKVLTAASSFPSTDPARLFAKRLFMVTTVSPNPESAVDDLMMMLLEQVGFSSNNWVVSSRNDTELLMSGGSTEATADLVVYDITSKFAIAVSLVEEKVQENAEAQLMAEGVAAAQRNAKHKRPQNTTFLIRALGTKLSFYYGDFTKLADVVKVGLSELQTHPIYKFPAELEWNLVLPEHRKNVIITLDQIKFMLQKEQ